MKKITVIIFTLVFASACFSVAAENSSTVSTAGPPPILNIYGTSTTAGVQSFNQNQNAVSQSASPQTAARTGSPVSAGPLPGGQPAPMPPGAPPVPPGAGFPGAAPLPPGSAFTGTTGGYSYSSQYSINLSTEMVQKVLATAAQERKYLREGKVWILRGPGGELQIKGGLVYRDVVVSVIGFDPVNGSVLPAEYRPVVYQESTSLKNIKRQFSTIVNNLKILAGAWYRAPEGYWVVPLTYKNEVVASLKIYCDGIHVIPDYEATQEMAYYGS